ncbi:MAG: hypothetical protein HQ567_23585 [Candidatus Nealsonbacteria bacterium]|nr:hypothetical protein [Candidatus Nealsonbacteria bacterium]
MNHRLVSVAGLLLSVVTVSAAAAESLPPAARWIPSDAVLAVEVSQPKTLLGPLVDEKTIAAVTELPAYQKQTANPGFQQFRGIVALLELTLGTDWPTAVTKLTGGGVTLAVCPDDKVILIVDAEDEQLLAKLHDILLNFARSEAKKQGQPDRVKSEEYEGVTAWSFNGEEAHAIIGRRLIFGNRKEALKAVLDLRSKPDAKSLASAPTYLKAKRAVGSDCAATVFVDLATLKHVPGVAAALNPEAANPLVALLFAGIVEPLRTSNWLAMGLRLEQDTLVLQTVVDGKAGDPKGPAAFALPGTPADGALPNLQVPRRIAAMTLYRDLHRFYAAKDDLFPERTSGLIFFENMMGIFFSGRDLTDEVLAYTRPEVRLVVAGQKYDPAIGTPQMQLPAFALVLRLKDAEKHDAVFEEAWQKALGLINFTRGQQAEPGLIIDRPTHGETKFTSAGFSAAGIEDRKNLPQRFNFYPAIAMPSDYLVLSSTEQLTRDLIDALRRETAQPIKPLAQTHSALEIDATGLGAILQANRVSLVRNNMVEEGNTEAEAETSIDLLITVAKMAGHARLSIDTHQGHARATLKLKPRLP